ncbi:MAG TPA: fatty acid desaturase [Rhizomicrobium sp.]|jgi:fatty acid desaturase
MGPARINATLLAIAASAAVLQFFVFPLFMPVSALSIALLLAFLAITTPLTWGLLHESIHGKLFADDAANRFAGRLLGYALCLNWDMMRFGHLMHHRANRHEHDRPEDVAPGGSILAAAPLYYLTLLGGGSILAAAAPLPILLPLSATESLTPHIFPEPGLREAAKRAFTDPARRIRVRVDFVVLVLLLVGTFWLYGAHWPVLLACIATRFVMLSLLDNAPHYGTPKDSGTRAYNTTMPRRLRWLVLNANFHGVHHHAPQLAWTELPNTFAGSYPGRFEGSWIAMIFRQFRGPVRLS